MIILKCVPHVQHAYVNSFDQSNSSFVALSLPLPPSMLNNTFFLRELVKCGMFSSRAAV